MKRGNRRLKPRDEDVNPRAAVDTGLSVTLFLSVRGLQGGHRSPQRSLCTFDFPDFMRPEIDIRLVTFSS